MILFPQSISRAANACASSTATWRSATVFNNDPAAQARAFERQGFEYLHVVDLDGAFAGKPMQRQAVEQILVGDEDAGAARRRHPRHEDRRGWLEKGVARVIIGTAAVEDPGFRARGGAALSRAASRSASTPRTAGRGRRLGEDADMSALDLGRSFEDAGVAAIIYTDIARDGILQGLNIEATLALAEAVAIPVIASGGLASLDDVKRLLQPDCAELAGAITGRALYDGRLDAAEALAMIRGRRRKSA